MSDDGKLACVTGARGYLGSHVVRELLARGYTVRGTVRNAEDETKVAHLRELAADCPERLTLHSADLLDEGAFDDIIADCDYVYHVASAVFLTASDPQREIVDPAVKGTENVFRAIAAAGTVKGVGLTSSIAAILSTEPRPDHSFTEEDWVEDATLATNPYGLGKKLAEKAAWKARESLPLEQRFDMVVVNPVLVIGPALTKVHLRSSPSVIRDLMRGAFKGAPNLGFGLVDVRDVTKALINGVEAGDKSGRYILHNEFMWMKEIAEVIEEEFPDRRIPTRKIPNFVLYLVAIFDKRMSWAFLKRNLNRRSAISNNKVREDLGIELTDIRTSIADTCRSFIEHGLV